MKMNIQKKIISIMLFIAILFTASPFVPKTYAVWGLEDLNWDAGNFVPNLEGAGASTGTLGETIAEWAAKKADELADNLLAARISFVKVLALLSVQFATSLMVGGDNDLIIRDYNNYLFVSPAQTALTQMNTFYNTVSKGRLSSLNYEGIGPNYDSYLVSNAKQNIKGTSFQTDIQEYVTYPNVDLFSSGNMKGIMSYFKCANNVPCYTLATGEEYKDELAKAQEIAKAEQQNGLLPIKINGRINKPATLVSSALTQLDQIGTQLIIQTDISKDANDIASYYQIAQGAALSIGSRAANYYISDDKGKAAIAAQANQFPFSLSYSSKGGVAVGGANKVVQ